MVRIRLVIGDSETGKTTQLELSEQRSRALHGRVIGEVIEGDSLGLSGYRFKIRGGSDTTGTPMRSDVHGAVRKRLLLRGGVGYRARTRGERRRRRVRGNEITDEIIQVNVLMITKGSKPLLELVEKPKSTKR